MAVPDFALPRDAEAGLSPPCGPTTTPRPAPGWPYVPRDALQVVRAVRAFGAGTGVAVRRAELDRDVVTGTLALGSALTADRAVLSLLALSPELAGVDLERALYLDFETTGLGGTGCFAFLAGMCWFEGGRFVLEQLLLTEPDDEPELILRVAARIAASEVVVSYNGKSFDLPLLRGRLALHRAEPLPPRPMLDLLHLARRVHRSRAFRKTLRTVEVEVLGLGRGPDVAGEEIAARYHHYLRSGDFEPLWPVVDHNAADVLAMLGLVGFYGEPFERLAADELADVARVFRRAGALDRALDAAELAVGRERSAGALRVRAEVQKARGDVAAALADLEILLAGVDDPAARLELAKLYEHHVRAPARALELVEQGTAEPEPARERRRQRLVRKLRTR
ncbi:MAG: ribonuclease H-like domain-containing protein [Polyangiaceae bacterium]|nr:ribonuclease H-like domain-containing protein [Polyangiaceae bacterium]